MIDLFVTARLVVTMDPSHRTVEDGAIAVHGGRILAIGPRADILAAYPQARRTVGGPDFVALPGFVDGHSHAGHGLVRTLGGDDFPAWRAACRSIYMDGAPLAFWQAEAQLSALERIKAGVTTAVCYLGGGDENNRSDSSEVATAYAEAYTAIGGRLVVGVGPTRPPYPRSYTWFDEGGAPHRREVSFAEQRATCERLLAELPSERVRVALTTPTVNPEIHAGPHFDELCAVARSMKALARDHGAVLMMDGQRAGTVAFARELGLLDDHTLLSHALDITPDEVHIVAETGATVANNPLSNSAVWGRCPVPELLQAGAHVIVCSDGLAPDCGADMFRVMRACGHSHRMLARDPHLLPPGRLLRMTTRDPARFFGLEAEVGSLDIGKSADIALVDLRRPHLAPATMPLYQIAYNATGQDVDTVLVAGRVVMQGRCVEAIDEAAVLARARTEAERMLERTGLAHLLETPASFWEDRYDRPAYAGPHGTRRAQPAAQ